MKLRKQNKTWKLKHLLLKMKWILSQMSVMLVLKNSFNEA
jgi:hypothetical protein